MGPVAGLENFFAACAFTSGIAASGGAGQAVANWIMHGDPGYDLWAFDVRRFGKLHGGQKFLHERAVESYSKYYAISWPGEELQSARGIRRSALYEPLKKQGAVFGSKFGWERPNWFSTNNIDSGEILSFDRMQHADTIGHEHRAAREGVVAIDMSSFTKFEISGTNACSFLQFLAVGNVDKPVGGATYTQLCNERGGIEADVTIIRRSQDCFWLITGSAFGVRDGQWISDILKIYCSRNTSTNIKVQHLDKIQVDIRDITSSLGVINVAGPLARKLLQSICDDDLGHEAFPFMSAQDIRVGYAPLTAFRVTYIGELGWELYIPVEYMQYVYELLMQNGAKYKITNIGYHAIDSLRLEKRYLAWGLDITPDYNPYEAGLQFLIDWKKSDFMGAQALKKIKSDGVNRKLACLVLNQKLSVFGGEAILADGRAIGQTTSANFGYTINKPLVLGYIGTAYIDQTPEFSIEAFGKSSCATLIKGAAYDPTRAKILS